MADDIPELEGEKLTTNDAPTNFANKVSLSTFIFE